VDVTMFNERVYSSCLSLTHMEVVMELI